MVLDKKAIALDHQVLILYSAHVHVTKTEGYNAKLTASNTQRFEACHFQGK